MLNQGWTYHDRIKLSDVGLTLLDYYCQRYRHSDRAQWQARILAGQIRLDGQIAHPDRVLQTGQSLSYTREPWIEPTVPLSFGVIYEDDDLLVIHKPAGLPVQPGGGFLTHTLWHLLEQRYGDHAPKAIHRLGRGTSGLMLLAKSQKARASLSTQMRDRQLQKTYRALVGKATSLPDRLLITHPIGKIDHPVLGYVYGAVESGLWAQSQVEVLERRSQTTLLAVQILTGRPHQIRIHLAAIGFPLWGDPLYAVGGIPRSSCIEGLKTDRGDALAVPGDCGYQLHAYQVVFRHPTTGESMTLTCPAPEILCSALEISPISRYKTD